MFENSAYFKDAKNKKVKQNAKDISLDNRTPSKSKSQKHQRGKLTHDNFSLSFSNTASARNPASPTAQKYDNYYLDP